jgi:2-polyprenyl-3-methyl-5-hydroxy-6-metoxy-1,4-benzoquinol methylase
MPTSKNSYEYPYQNSHPDHHHTYLIKPLIKLLADQKRPNPNQHTLRVLDLGCGNGSLSHLISQQGYEVVGVDESSSGIKFACLSYPHCHFIQASIYNLPYKELSSSFDIVISCEVIEHLLYPKELIRSAKKCLKPKGQLIITTPYHGYIKNLTLAVLGKLDQHFTVLWDGGHIKFFSVATLTKMLEEQGFKEIRFKFAGRLPYLWKSMICYCQN